MKLVYGYFIQKDNKRWFWARSEGGLYCWDKLRDKIGLEFVCQKENTIIKGDCLFEDILLFDDSIFLVPRYAKEILVYNLVQREAIKIPLPEEPEMQADIFLKAYETEQEIILIPQSYHRILHIDKKRLIVKMGDFCYRSYENDNNFAKNSRRFVFGGLPVVHREIMYLPIYNAPQIVVYCINSMKYSIYNTKKLPTTDKIEVYENDEVKILIIERLECFKIEKKDKIIINLLSEFLDGRYFIRAIKYYNSFYLFMKDGIYVLRKDERKIKLVEWYFQIEDDYLRRIHLENGDRLQDTLYVFQNENTLIISFELENDKCIIKIDKDKVYIEYEKMIKLSDIDVWAKAVIAGIKNKSKMSRCFVGEKIYQVLNEK